MQKIPGIETEADYEDIVSPQSASQGYKSTVAQRVAAAHQSAGCDKNVTATPRRVDGDDVSATQFVIDLTDDNLLLSGLPMSVKQEMVNRRPVKVVYIRPSYFKQFLFNGRNVQYGTVA